MSSVIAFPYSFANKESIWQSVQHIFNESQHEVRVRIWPNKTAAALLVYESAYTYCPTGSVIVHSRFNVRFKKNFSQMVTGKISAKFHFYTVNFQREGRVHNFSTVTNYSDKIRREGLYLRSHFQPLQIFKTDLLKTHYMHILKCEEIDFYETEAAFIFPLLESIRLNLLKIPEVLFEVIARK